MVFSTGKFATFLCRDLNLEPPEYEVGMVITGTQLSLTTHLYLIRNVLNAEIGSQVTGKMFMSEKVNENHGLSWGVYATNFSHKVCKAYRWIKHRL